MYSCIHVLYPCNTIVEDPLVCRTNKLKCYHFIVSLSSLLHYPSYHCLHTIIYNTVFFIYSATLKGINFEICVIQFTFVVKVVLLNLVQNCLFSTWDHLLSLFHSVWHACIVLLLLDYFLFPYSFQWGFVGKSH